MAAKTASVNRLPRKNVCGLDGSGISILAAASVGKAFGSRGAPASRCCDDWGCCGNVEGETTAVSPSPTLIRHLSPKLPSKLQRGRRRFRCRGLKFGSSDYYASLDCSIAAGIFATDISERAT